MKDSEKRNIASTNAYVWDLAANRPPLWPGEKIQNSPKSRKKNIRTRMTDLEQRLKGNWRDEKYYDWDEFEDDDDYQDPEIFAKYYDCFRKIWGWDTTKKNPEKGVADLQALMQAQSRVQWDKKEPLDPEMQFAVGVAYLSGWLTSINSNEPLLWFFRSAAQHDPRGLLAMGYLHEKGLSDCPRDSAVMISCYRWAAELGSAPAKYRLAAIALELKVGDRKNVCRLLAQAAPEYYPAKVLLAREFPEVTGSRKYRTLYKDEWEDLAEHDIPAVDIDNKLIAKDIISLNDKEFEEFKYKLLRPVEPTPVLGWGVNSDPDEAEFSDLEDEFEPSEEPDEVYPWEDEAWSSQAPAVAEAVTELDPELEEIFSRFFGNENNTETEEATPELDWKKDTVILPPLEELLEPEKYAAGKENGIVFDLQETEEKRESANPLVQQLLQEFRVFTAKYQKDQEDGRAERKKLQQTAERIDKNTRHIEKIVVGNQELLISLDVSVKVLQCSLQGMWSELKKTEEEFCEKLDKLQKQVQNHLNSIPQEELKNAEEFMALIFLGDWRKPGRLSNESCDALVAAHVLMKAAENLGVKNYAGIVITAVWALEYECRRRFYDKFDRYLENCGVNAQDRPLRMKLKDKYFTLGSVEFVTYSDDYNEFSRTTNLLSKVAKKEQKRLGFSDAEMIWRYRLSGTAGPDGREQSFKNLVVKLNQGYRKPAAHAKIVSKEAAAECYNMLGITDVHKDMNSIQGALKALLWLTAPLEED